MKSFSIAMIALVVTVGATAAQQRSERPDQERIHLRQQIEQLEARSRQLAEQLAAQRADPRVERELRDVEVALSRLHAELQGMAAEARDIAPEMQHLERVLAEQHRVARELEEHNVRETEARTEALQRLREQHVEQAERMHEEAQALADRLHQERTDIEPERALELDRMRAEQTEAMARAQHELQQSADAMHRMSTEQAEAMARVQHDVQRTEAELQRMRAEEARAMNRAQQEMQRDAREQERNREIDRRALEERLDRMRADERVERAREPSRLDFEARLDRLYRDGPRASRARQDPADSLWRAARDQMNRGAYRDAARLFERIHSGERYRESTYRADALYWHAFALNRMGSRENIRQSMELLQQLTREYPAEDRHADTNGLLTTVQVRLAEMGSPNALQQVRAVAVSDEARVAYEQAVQQVEQVRAANLAQQAALVSEQARRVDDVERAIALQSVTATQNGMVLGAALGPDVATYVNWGLPVSRVGSLSPQCARDESEIQLIALNSLVRMDTAAAMPVMREVLARRDECTAPLRQSAMMIVARIRTPEAQRILTEAARNDPDTGVRRSALLYLASRDEPQAVTIAREALDNAQTTEERQWALQALARMRTESAWAIIRDFAGRTDIPTDTRRAAIAMLSGSNDSTNAAFLRSLYGRVGQDRSLKEAILMSSAFRRAGSDPEWLLAIAEDAGEDQRIREFAVTALSRNSDVGTQQFIELYDRMDEKRVKLSILRVLADRADSESAAVDKLISIARTESDADLRKSAVLGLPANDPRARELLLEILRGM